MTRNIVGRWVDIVGSWCRGHWGKVIAQDGERVTVADGSIGDRSSVQLTRRDVRLKPKGWRP